MIREENKTPDSMMQMLVVNSSDGKGNVVAHLEMIEGIINRMGTNSFAMKAISATIVGALFSFGFKAINLWLTVLAIILIVVLAFVDARYLQMEREYRALYDKVRLQKSTDFSMERKKTGMKGFFASLFDWPSIPYVFFIGVVLVSFFVNASSSPASQSSSAVSKVVCLLFAY